jgi:hypothetical protein
MYRTAFMADSPGSASRVVIDHDQPGHRGAPLGSGTIARIRVPSPGELVTAS